MADLRDALVKIIPFFHPWDELAIFSPTFAIQNQLTQLNVGKKYGKFISVPWMVYMDGMGYIMFFSACVERNLSKTHDPNSFAKEAVL